MNNMPINRRNFLKTVGLAGASLALPGCVSDLKPSAINAKSSRILFLS